jgi:hypothetical protein
MDRLHAIRDVTSAYFYGVVVGSLLILVVMGLGTLLYPTAFGTPGAGLGPGEIIFSLAIAPAIIGMGALLLVPAALLLGAPLLLTAIAVVLLFLHCIERRLLAWCIAAPFVAALAWAFIELTVLAGRRTSVESHLMHPTALLYVALVFSYAAVGSWKFYRLNSPCTDIPRASMVGATDRPPTDE